jgi:hypothetical protein
MLAKALPGYEARRGDTVLNLTTREIQHCIGQSQFGRILVGSTPGGRASVRWERYDVLVIDRSSNN